MTNFYNIKIKYLFILFFSLCFAPTAHGESTVQEIITSDNKTFNIIVESPTNEIHVQINNTEIDRLITSIENMQTKNLGYDNGDILISSATILSFLGFGSFLIIRGNYANKSNLIWKKTTIVLSSVCFIVILHLYIIIEIVFNIFSIEKYIFMILLTMIDIGIITITMISINRILSEIQNMPETVTNIDIRFKNLLQNKYEIEKNNKK